MDEKNENFEQNKVDLQTEQNVQDDKPTAFETEISSSENKQPEQTKNAKTEIVEEQVTASDVEQDTEQKEEVEATEIQQNNGSTENQPASEEQKEIVEPKKINFDEEALKNQSKLMSIKQVGNALSNITIACMIISFAIVVGGILLFLLEFAFVFFVGIVLVFLAIASLGLLLLSEEYKDAWRFLGKVLDNEKQQQVLNFLFSLVPYIIVAGTVTGLASIIVLSCAKNQKSTGRIVATSICFGILMVLVVILIAGGLSK